VADELYDALLRFHQEVVQPELNEIRKELRGEMQSMRSEMATKADLQAIRDEMATKAELQAMRGEMVTWSVLMQFHQEIVRPEIEEVRSKLADLATRDEMLSHVDGLYVRFGILDSEYHALSAAVRRIEEQMAQQKVDIGGVRSELVKINDQISQLSQRVTNLENVMN